MENGNRTSELKVKLGCTICHEYTSFCWDQWSICLGASAGLLVCVLKSMLTMLLLVHTETRLCMHKQDCARRSKTVYTEARLCTLKQNCTHRSKIVHTETRLCTQKQDCAHRNKTCTPHKHSYTLVLTHRRLKPRGRAKPSAPQSKTGRSDLKEVIYQTTNPYRDGRALDDEWWVLFYSSIVRGGAASQGGGVCSKEWEIMARPWMQSGEFWC